VVALKKIGAPSDWVAFLDGSKSFIDFRGLSTNDVFSLVTALVPKDGGRAEPDGSLYLGDELDEYASLVYGRVDPGVFRATRFFLHACPLLPWYPQEKWRCSMIAVCSDSTALCGKVQNLRSRIASGEVIELIVEYCISVCCAAIAYQSSRPKTFKANGSRDYVRMLCESPSKAKLGSVSVLDPSFVGVSQEDPETNALWLQGLHLASIFFGKKPNDNSRTYASVARTVKGSPTGSAAPFSADVRLSNSPPLEKKTSPASLGAYCSFRKRFSSSRCC